jgi:hypothetical protein
MRRIVLLLVLLAPASAGAVLSLPYCRLLDALDAIQLVCDFTDEQIIPEPPPLPRVRRLHRAPVFSIALGGGYRAMYDVPYGSGQLDLGVGADVRHVEIAGHLILEAGAPHPRLPITQLRVGFSARAVLGRFRLGGGVRLGLVFFDRVTRDETQTAGTFSPFISLSVDLFKRGRYALLLGVDAGLDVMITSVEGPLISVGSSLAAAATGYLGARL